MRMMTVVMPATLATGSGKVPPTAEYAAWRATIARARAGLFATLISAHVRAARTGVAVTGVEEACVCSMTSPNGQDCGAGGLPSAGRFDAVVPANAPRHSL